MWKEEENFETVLLDNLNMNEIQIATIQVRSLKWEKKCGGRIIRLIL